MASHSSFPYHFLRWNGLHWEQPLIQRPFWNKGWRNRRSGAGSPSSATLGPRLFELTNLASLAFVCIICRSGMVQLANLMGLPATVIKWEGTLEGWEFDIAKKILSRDTSIPYWIEWIQGPVPLSIPASLHAHYESRSGWVSATHLTDWVPFRALALPSSHGYKRLGSAPAEKRSPLDYLFLKGTQMFLRWKQQKLQSIAHPSNSIY